MKNKVQKILLIIVSVSAIILELLPYGAVLNFALDGGSVIRKTYSYFDLTPYGYANFGPLLTAVLTCALLVICIINLFKNSRRLRKTISVISLIALVGSLTPLLYGIESFSVVGVFISLILLFEFGLSLIKVETDGSGTDMI